MHLSEFKPDDLTDYLNQELPGFEPSLIRESRTDSVTLRVRSRLSFGAYAEIPAEHLMIPLPNYEIRNTIDQFIRKTRQDMIHKLGLQKEIDLEVKRQVERERQRIENEAYRKAMNDALDRTVKAQEEAREKLAAGLWNTFMGRDIPTEGETL